MRNPLDRRRWRQNSRLCGVDEVGRGSIAGPVVAAAVILPPNCRLPGVNDSKLLTPRQRAELFDRIAGTALAWAVGSVNHRGVDRLNIRQASFRAMHKAIARLSLRPDYAFIDGFRLPGLNLPHEGIIGGDRRSLTVAAASVIAKVWRDRVMERLALCYPGYDLDQNKGYPVPGHLAALVRLGPSPIHRRTYAPVRELQLFPA